jgi:hypothetical protein
MKRISTILVFLALLPGVTNAYWPWYCGVHYTPYAFDYHHSGLVGPTVDYTPYAFDYHHSGLVAGYGCYGGYGYAIPIVGRSRVISFGPGVFQSSTTSGSLGLTRIAADNAPSEIPAPRPKDGLTIIRDYLYAQGFNSVSVNRILRINGKLIGVDFTLPDQKLVVKYWDPKEVERLRSGPASRQTLYERHRQDWENYADRYRQIGGEVYCVEGSDAQTIVAALQSCPRLDIGGTSPSRPVMYAKGY